MGRVEGKVAIVTGAASGLGRGAAEMLAKEGAAVALTDIDDKAGEAAAAAIRASGGQAVFLRQDVTDEVRWNEVFVDVTHEFGKVNILVNNAGVAFNCDLVDIETEQWRKVLAINLDSVFYGMRVAIREMAGTGGSIINISSVAGIVGTPQLASYAASKGGVRALTKSAAIECAFARNEVRVNSIHPGTIDTAIWGLDEADRAKLLKYVATLIPMRRVGEVSDVAYAVVYLASDESRFVTGIELPIDGGQIAM